MTLRSAARGVALAATALLATGAGAQTVDLYGVTQATLAWAPASGSIAGYYVIVARNGDPPSVYGFSTGTQTTVDAAIGDELTVSVAAYDASGVAGPVSAPSPTIRFNAATSGSSTTGGSTGGSTGSTTTTQDPSSTDPTLATTASGTPLDFNGDGTSDLLLQDDTGALSLWRMSGSTVLGVDALGSVPLSWRMVGNGDYDGNGVADILWQNSDTGQLDVVLMTAGVPDGGTALDLGLDPAAEWQVGGSGDFDGDGQDDILLFSRILGKAEIVGMSGGAVASRTSLDGYTGAWSVAAIGDVDGDGVDEIVWRDEVGGQMVLWDPDGTGGVTRSVLADSVAGWSLVGAGDFDGDGDADLFAVHSAPDQLEVWLLQGGAIVGSLELPVPSGGLVATSVGDFDGDSLSDVLLVDAASGSAQIWFSDGSSGIVAQTVNDTIPQASAVVSGVASDASAPPQPVCSGDFNGDGAVNVTDATMFSNCMGQAPTGSCSVADMNGDGTINVTDATLFVTALNGGGCGQ